MKMVRFITKAKAKWGERQRNIEKLGFKTYTDYLRSDLWKAIRKQVYAEKGRDCSIEGCIRKAHDIHHTDYKLKTMKGDNRKSLHPVCTGCHDKIEDGAKLPLKTKRKRGTLAVGVAHRRKWLSGKKFSRGVKKWTKRKK
jgi:hypothetical protein